MDCGYQQLPGFPEQEQIAGVRMAELRDVLDLVKRYRAHGITLNIETKVEAGAPEQTAPRELFVRRVFEEIRRSGIERQVTIQSCRRRDPRRDRAVPELRVPAERHDRRPELPLLPGPPDDR
ncbi:hypothetical protein ABZ328_05715 [Micromonospora aurantiaca]|uniref:hypothetical protein n=1 Tax=Micromonospora aurantiaca (nom. illeg.) TaxID=47850 RepID=UPI0033C6737F